MAHFTLPVATHASSACPTCQPAVSVDLPAAWFSPKGDPGWELRHGPCLAEPGVPSDSPKTADRSVL